MFCNDFPRFSCVTVILENFENVKKSTKISIFKTNVYVETLNIEDITSYEKKDQHKCLFFCVVSELKLQFLFSFLSRTNSTLLEDSSWYFYQDNHNIVFDSKLIGLNSDVNFLEEKNGTIYFKEVYSINGIDGLIENVYGYYNKDVGIMQVEKDKLVRRSDLRGVLLKAIVLQDPGYVKIDKNLSKYSFRNKNKVGWSGIIPDVFESLAESLNFSFALIPPKDGTFGSYNAESDSWSGIVKDIMDGDADMSGNGLFFTYPRSKAINFSIPFLSTDCVFLVSTQTSFSWDIFLGPFHTDSWVILYISILLITGLMVLIMTIGREDNIEEFGLIQSFVFVYGAYSGFASRRWNISPSKTSGRYEETKSTIQPDEQK